MTDREWVNACWIVCETRRRHPDTWFVPNPTLGKAIRRALEKRGAVASRPMTCRPTNCPERPAAQGAVKPPSVGMQYKNVDRRYLDGAELDELCREVVQLAGQRR